ncbi:cyclic lactone autoinducer peptide [Paenibacillus solisilvae]|uniref:Cyclic lactone autoinducer peptide n=1 Tax=Paenibacillus solisilvae TaxID=2486751 RepID=A0ABW0VVF8_9BACL
MTKKALYRFASFLALIAVVVVSTASTWYVYQGDTPEELL